jgi:Trk K+ transport system NAD-binding subunit
MTQVALASLYTVFRTAQSAIVEGPILLCGLGRVGWRVLDYLRTAGLPVVAIDDHADPDDPRLCGVRFVRGDFRNRTVLEEAGVQTARGVLVVTSDDLVNIYAALIVRRINPDVRIVLRMFNQTLMSRLGKAVINITGLSVSALAAPILALTALTGDVLAAFPVGHGRRQVAEVAVEPSSRLAGLRVGEFIERQPFLVLAHTPAGHQPRLLQEVDAAAVIGPGDRLIVCGESTAVRRLLQPGSDDFTEVLWAGKLRRWGRLIWRTLAEMDLAVKVCTLTLLAVILFSTAVYHFGFGHTWPDSLYRTISLIATGADMGGERYEGWGKVFVSFLRISGTALVAAFTAIVTNYLLRARLGGAFEVRRIPEKGHIVVCGLGNIGFRVVEELIGAGERVVVIEREANNPFIASSRREGAAVIVGDATIPEVLRQARAGTAAAVITATSKDLVNLEIALLLSEIHPQQRAVVRLSDPLLAETIRAAASVRLALSVPELAAPAFVAGLLGDRVQAMFLAGGKMMAVLEVTVPADDPRLTDRSLRELATDYRVVPVAVVRDGQELPHMSSDERPKPGDRLIVVAALPDVERLLRREPAAVETTTQKT